MAEKIITIVGITGNQGASVADEFIKTGDWHVRGITRDPTKPASQLWADKGVELVAGDLNDAASLKSAFAGSTVIFGVTDFWGILGGPRVQEAARVEGTPANVLAHNIEVQQGRNIVDAANTTLKTLDRFVLSTLSATKKWSKGKYIHNFHFDGKWEAVEYLQTKYPALAKKSSYLQVGLYVTNWKGIALARPNKQHDGTYVLSLPIDGNAPVAMVEARHDTGKFVKALVQVDAGKNLLGYSSLLSWNEFTALWGKIHDVTCYFHRLDRNILENAVPGGVGEELADMYEYIGEFGYDGGDPSIVHPKDLGIDISVYTVEQYVRDEDWSEVL